MKRLQKALAPVAQQAITAGLTMAGGLLLREMLGRTFPEIQATPHGSAYAALGRLLGEKPGAPRFYEHDDTTGFGFGRLTFRHNGHLFFAWQEAGNRSRYQQQHQSPLSVRALTGGWPSLEGLIHDAEILGVQAPEGGVRVYAWSPGWIPLPHCAARPLSSVALERGVETRLLGDVQGFLADEAWYRSRHVPYRRGYLLYGPAGSGKTTLAGALAGEAGLGICVLSLASVDLTDETLGSALRDMPKRTVLLLEDVDAVNAHTERRVPHREEWKGSVEAMTLTTHPAGKLTLAGILNALDGLTTPSGLIVIMTTNHREKLDPALIRPGRVDVHAEIGLATQQQAHDLYLRFFPEYPENAARFSNTITPGTLSPAAIQEHLVRHRFDPEGAAGAIENS